MQWELINIFRYTDEGRLVEEWVQTDTYDFLRQLGAMEDDDRDMDQPTRQDSHRLNLHGLSRKHRKL